MTTWYLVSPRTYFVLQAILINIAYNLSNSNVDIGQWDQIIVDELFIENTGYSSGHILFVIIQSDELDLLQLQSTQNKTIFMSTPLGGGHIIFAFSAVRSPDAWFPLI